MKELDFKDWKTKLYIIFTIIGLLTVIIGLSLYFYKYSFLLNKNNRITKGVIIERQARRKSDVYVICKFILGSQSFKVTKQVDNFEYENNCIFHEGDSVIIKYYQLDPEISEVDLETTFKNWKLKESRPSLPSLRN